MRTAAILPIKRFVQAKQRLAPALPAGLRTQLAQVMLEDVMDALDTCSQIERVFLVSAEPLAVQVARDRNATVVTDRREQGQSAAAELGIGAAIEAGFERVLCVPGDCPALDPEQLDELLGEADATGAHVTVVPDRHLTGTNALLLQPPDVIAPGFGPDSLKRHLNSARAVGLKAGIAKPSSLLLDIDTSADLKALLERLGDLPPDSRTRALLGGRVSADALPSGG